MKSHGKCDLNALLSDYDVKWMIECRSLEDKSKSIERTDETIAQAMTATKKLVLL
jgi:hypothetical protein